MNRRVEREWLDELPPRDAGAAGSRRDLRRLNWWMGNARIVARELRSALNIATPLHVLELGAGDGHFLLEVARHLGPQAKGTTATLLDRQELLTPEIVAAFDALDWTVESMTCDVSYWIDRTRGDWQVIIVNLFLHHFDLHDLRRILEAIADSTPYFIALEPRRCRHALLFSKCVGVIGCNSVTRHDAPASVRAGFRDAELSNCWPSSVEWKLHERSAGTFGHLFVARRQVLETSIRNDG